MKKLSIASIVLLCALLPGCATIFSGTQAKISVADGDPSHAKIFLNGNFLGETPTSFKIPKKSFGKETTLEIRADGYKTVFVKIDKRVQAGWVVVDVLTGLVAVVVDFATGAIYKADPDRVEYRLEKL